VDRVRFGLRETNSPGTCSEDRANRRRARSWTRHEMVDRHGSVMIRYKSKLHHIGMG
jgi:hypothetical protein